jgi:hypothetical protein
MTEILNLWPKNFKVDVQSPVAILRSQASLLSQVTRGVLHANVETETTDKGVQHRLVIVAPAYNQYRHVLLVARHDARLPYPTTVVNDALAERVRREPNVLSLGLPTYETVYPQAHSDDELITYIKTALGSDSTKAVVLSLIAKSNETTAASTAQGPSTQDVGPNEQTS